MSRDGTMLRHVGSLSPGEGSGLPHTKAQCSEHYGYTKQAAILWTEQNGDSRFVAPGGVSRPQNTRKTGGFAGLDNPWALGVHVGWADVICPWDVN